MACRYISEKIRKLRIWTIGFAGKTKYLTSDSGIRFSIFLSAIPPSISPLCSLIRLTIPSTSALESAIEPRSSLFDLTKSFTKYLPPVDLLSRRSGHLIRCGNLTLQQGRQAELKLTLPSNYNPQFVHITSRTSI